VEKGRKRPPVEELQKLSEEDDNLDNSILEKVLPSTCQAKKDIFEPVRKPPVPKIAKKKKKVVKKEDTQVVDYSEIYSNFYEIFNQFVMNPKYFDPEMIHREVRNLYAQFLSLMNVFDNNPHMRKFEFEAAPLEKTYQDYL
jgi:hypothetical protein